MPGPERRRHLPSSEPPGSRPDAGPLRPVSPVRVLHRRPDLSVGQADAEARRCRVEDVAAVVSGQEEGEGQLGQAEAADERIHALRQEVSPRAHPAASGQGQQVKSNINFAREVLA